MDTRTLIGYEKATELVDGGPDVEQDRNLILQIAEKMITARGADITIGAESPLWRASGTQAFELNGEIQMQIAFKSAALENLTRYQAGLVPYKSRWGLWCRLL
jgi:hypothetical protein